MDSRVWMAQGELLVLLNGTYETLKNFQLVFFSAIYSPVFQTKSPNVEVCGAAVQEESITVLILVHFFCWSVYTGLVTFWSDCNSSRLNKTVVEATA